jgi:hypothetical protein
MRVGIGSVSQPNTSFKGDSGNPVGRWKEKMSREELGMFEEVVGPTLTNLGYPLAYAGPAPNPIAALRLRRFYRSYFDAKFWFKNSRLGTSYLGPMSGKTN